MNSNIKQVATIIFLILLICLLLHCYPVFATNRFPCCSDEEFETLKLKDPPMSGANVREIQKQLKRLGFYSGKIDGIYGPETYISVKNFQESYGLESDGIIGLRTLECIFEIYEEASYQPSQAPTGEIAILIDISERKLYILTDGEIYKKYPVAVGKWETPTPIGNWKITQKAIWGKGFGSRWMRINVPWGIYGIHGTNKPWSIGSFASAGCIRMLNKHVEEVYGWVKVGTPVVIVGGPYGTFTSGRKTLVRGDKGSDVLEVQKRLKGLGFYQGNLDGIFGRGMEKAVKYFQESRNLKVDGQVTARVYDELGIILFE